MEQIFDYIAFFDEWKIEKHEDFFLFMQHLPNPWTGRFSRRFLKAFFIILLFWLIFLLWLLFAYRFWYILTFFFFHWFVFNLFVFNIHELFLVIFSCFFFCYFQTYVDRALKRLFWIAFLFFELPHFLFRLFYFKAAHFFDWINIPTYFYTFFSGFVNDFRLFLNKWNFFVFADVPVPYQMGFQDPATEFVEGIIDLHHDVFGYIVFISIFVFYMLTATVFIFRAHHNIRPPVDIRHNTPIEIIWTIVPTLVIIAIAVPSFILIYAMDELVGPQLTIKAIGNQWYWNYEYTDMSVRLPLNNSFQNSFLSSKYNAELIRNKVFTLFDLYSFTSLKSSFFQFFFLSTKKKQLLNLKPSLYFFELFICSLYLEQKYDFFDQTFSSIFLNFYNFYTKFSFPFSDLYLSFFYNLYLFNLTRTTVFNYFFTNLADYSFFGNFSNRIFSNFVSFFSSDFFFFSPEGKLVLFPFVSLKNFWFSFYYECFALLPYSKIDVTSFVLLFSFIQKYNWLQSFSLIEKFSSGLFDVFFSNFSSNVFRSLQTLYFSFYSCLPLLNSFFIKSNLYTVSDYLAVFSYNHPKKIPLSLKIESRMLDTDVVEKSLGQKFRLLSVDRPVIMPTETQIRFLTTANDVLHSWTIPSFGVKIDACPGRLNQVGIFIKREGIFYGQCSEICGVNHGFMPIEVRAYTSKSFLNWVTSTYYRKLGVSNV